MDGNLCIQTYFGLNLSNSAYWQITEPSLQLSLYCLLYWSGKIWPDQINPIDWSNGESDHSNCENFVRPKIQSDLKLTRLSGATSSDMSQTINETELQASIPNPIFVPLGFSWRLQRKKVILWKFLIVIFFFSWPN